MHQRRRDPRPAATQRMPQRNRPAVRIHSGPIQPQLPDTLQRLHRKRLVQLHNIQVPHRNPRTLQRLQTRRHRPQTHHRRINTRRRRRTHHRHHLQPQLPRQLILHHHQSSRPVIDPRRIPRRHRPILRKRRPQLCERLQTRIPTRMLIGIHHNRITLPLRHLHRHNLIRKPTRLNRRLRLHLRRKGKPILILPRHTIFLRHVLRRLAHPIRMMHRRQPRIRKPPSERRIVRLRNPPLIRHLRLRHHDRRTAHALHPAHDKHIPMVRLDHPGSHVQRSQARRTQPIKRHPGHRLRKTSQQPRHPRHVSVILTRLIRRPEVNVLNQVSRHSRPPDRLTNHDRRQIVRPNRRQTTPITTNRRPNRRTYCCTSHHDDNIVAYTNGRQPTLNAGKHQTLFKPDVSSRNLAAHPHQPIMTT